MRANHGAVDAGALLGLTAAAEDDLDSRPSHIDDGGEHDHDDFNSFVVTGGAVADSARLLVQAVGPRIQHHLP